ncbi:DUF2842 domain-containing protein [Vannielia sp.]|uniref:DUF2842 domain-containing protein n=1 Tax=Vannielia sp. TaxID=2813045 RepID=UPI002610BE53|nr:DUF2842 domain-containing protein [Vannielia sp.]MDF1871695.1 DUF2842 domain-containing protein [Vannielia sp.]
MALSWKARRRWVLVLLVVGLPAYIALSWWLLSLIPRPPILLELAVYVVLGFLWALPFKFLFRGVGKEEPEDERQD